MEELARAVLSVFRVQAQQARGDKVRFGDQDRKLAAALAGPMYKQYVERGLEPEEAKAAAEQRALESARSINDTSQERLENGNEPRDVFSAERAADIAATEFSYAKHEAMALVAKEKKQKLRWKTMGKPCPQCMSLNNKVVKAGKQFVSKNGTAVYGPPLHPACRCSISVEG